MTYNNKRHKQLVRRFLDLISQGKSLFYENSKEDGELKKYNAAVEEQIYWAHREKFVELIKNLLTDIIDFDEFDTDFAYLYNKTERECDLFVQDLEQIEKFQPSTRPEEFASVMSAIYRILESVDDGHLPEQGAINYIKDTCLKYQIFKDEIDIWT